MCVSLSLRNRGSVYGQSGTWPSGEASSLQSRLPLPLPAMPKPPTLSKPLSDSITSSGPRSVGVQKSMLYMIRMIF